MTSVPPRHHDRFNDFLSRHHAVREFFVLPDERVVPTFGKFGRGEQKPRGAFVLIRHGTVGQVQTLRFVQLHQSPYRRRFQQALQWLGVPDFRILHYPVWNS